ncbi:Slam-dependent surface lipoprotein [Novosphingobium sp. RD2P27]|uniref:Slam-dependent surface lipoprotein n=1 Tax=Novosphingobium kalidii TaxID=3230299 RepID=A0ABV2D3Q7_9SPHN
MRNVHLKLAAAALLASATLASSAHAQVVGASSDTSNVEVGASNAPPPHVPGRPGIGFPGSSTGSQKADFQTLQVFVPPVGGVTTITPAQNPQHPDQGYFSFARVGSNQVWFGEWSNNGSATTGNHTVYYAGSNATTVAPSAHSATYSVNGISDYTTRGLLSGTFNATFNGSGGGTLSGSLTGGGLTVNTGTTTISGANFTGSGTASATTSGGTVTGGNVTGTFFGSNAAALAGIATFTGNRQLNTAFGGTKN